MKRKMLGVHSHWKRYFSAIFSAVVIASGCSSGATRTIASDEVPATVIGDWTTEGGSGPSVMGLLLSAQGKKLIGRMRLSGREDHGEGTCDQAGCVLRLPRGVVAESRLEIRQFPDGQRLRVSMVGGAASARRYDYILVRHK